MATIPPNVLCNLKESAHLTFPPPPGLSLVTAVHTSALKAKSNHLNQVVGLRDGQVAWAGAVDEDHLQPLENFDAHVRPLIFDCINKGSNGFKFVRPGKLQTRISNPRDTIYRGDRPWLTIAECQGGSLALPLNDADGIMKWWEHPIPASALHFPGSKNSKLELNHLWWLPQDCQEIGLLAPESQHEVMQAVTKYFR